MFTGIVEEIGRVSDASRRALRVSASRVLEDLRLGDSIAVDGTCLTVTDLVPGGFAIGLQPETLRRTTLETIRVGQRVNLERALAANGRLGGHFVQGHVDCTARILSFTTDENAVVARFGLPESVRQYVVTKGFIAVDGVSLTVVEAGADSFAVSLVEYTRANIALLDKKPGDPVNLEVDIIAKYVERLLGKGDAQGISMELLARNGFV